jgi:hypothetical protein
MVLFLQQTNLAPVREKYIVYFYIQNVIQKTEHFCTYGEPSQQQKRTF